MSLTMKRARLGSKRTGYQESSDHASIITILPDLKRSNLRLTAGKNLQAEQI